MNETAMRTADCGANRERSAAENSLHIYEKNYKKGLTLKAPRVIISLAKKTT
ncbi:MAG: hypothetical protein ACOYJB_05130 [Christensenellaceae bacterium]|jgi:hypothetical protein